MGVLTADQLQRSEPTWDVARLFPNQGHWSEEEYLALNTPHLVEFSQGSLEVLVMPGQRHQRIVFFLARLLEAFVAARRLGEVLIAPFPVQVEPGKYREPDIVFMLAQNRHRQREECWVGADLVIEVVSPDDPNRDWIIKREEYARAEIPEYWIVDRRSRTITVLSLDGQTYAIHGEFGARTQATSLLLPGFAADVASVFAAAEE
jgi:Uma2 family endonuclease